MLELNIKCEDADQARIYLNAPQYHNLLSDLYNELHKAKKYSESPALEVLEVNRVLNIFYDDLVTVVEHHLGPY